VHRAKRPPFFKGGNFFLLKNVSSAVPVMAINKKTGLEKPVHTLILLNEN
jgi:hypothetical protein